MPPFTLCSFSCGHLLGALLALGLAGLASPLVVCTGYVCSTANCGDVTPQYCARLSPPQEYRPNASFCSCCPLCIPYSGEGELCDALPIPVLMGVPQNVRHCRNGLECINNHCRNQKEE